MPKGSWHRDRDGEHNPNWRGGKASHPLYWIYNDMVRRCIEPSHKRWASYGGRGIRVCQRWLDDFWAFVEDMGERPEGRTASGSRALYVLDRIDNDGNYEPSNCRWTTYSVSGSNRREVTWTQRSRNAKGQYV